MTSAHPWVILTSNLGASKPSLTQPVLSVLRYVIWPQLADQGSCSHQACRGTTQHHAPPP